MNNQQRILAISGASSGIGFSIVEHLSKMGNTVFAGARKAEDIARLSALDNVVGVRLDITSREEIEAFAHQIESSTGYLDVLINNAGVPGWGAIMDRDIAYFQKVMDVNLWGHVQMIQTLYPLLRKSESSPIIINVSSQAGNYAMPFWAPYHASKWAFEAFSDCLRRELLPFGIRVAVIQPGAIKSDAFNKQRDDFSKYSEASASEFHGRAIQWLQMAFSRPPKKEKDPIIVIKAVIHAIYSQNNRLYYQPGRRLVPDMLFAKLPQKWVDWITSRI